MNVNLMQKDYDCPICKARFKAPRPRTAKLSLIGTDNDLRPYYEGIDTIMYEVVACSSCGYVSAANTFDIMDNLSAERIKINLMKMSVRKIYLEEITEDEAIERYLTAIRLLEFKSHLDSEAYFLYSRLSWLYRVKDDEDSLENEFLSMKKAFDFLENAYRNEPMPFLEMDQSTVVFLLGETGRRIGNYDKANRYIGMSILDPKASPDIRERAKESKRLIGKDAEKSSLILASQGVKIEPIRNSGRRR